MSSSNCSLTCTFTMYHVHGHVEHMVVRTYVVCRGIWFTTFSLTMEVFTTPCNGKIKKHKGLPYYN